MARFLKFKFLIILKLNYNRGQSYKKYIKFWLFQKIVNFEFKYSLKWKMLRICVEK